MNISIAPQPCGVRADAETAEAIYLIKASSDLRATRQIRLLALKAVTVKKSLVICVPSDCRWDESLKALVHELSGVIRRENLP
jgi:hypothetical protein